MEDSYIKYIKEQRLNGYPLDHDDLDYLVDAAETLEKIKKEILLNSIRNRNEIK